MFNNLSSNLVPPGTSTGAHIMASASNYGHPTGSFFVTEPFKLPNPPAPTKWVMGGVQGFHDNGDGSVTLTGTARCSDGNEHPFTATFIKATTTVTFDVEGFLAETDKEVGYIALW